MSSEKRTIFADGHFHELPADIESGSPCECRSRDQQRSRGRRCMKRVVFFVLGFFVAQAVLHAAFGRHRMLERAYEYGRLSMWGHGYGDDVAHHAHPHWDHDRPGHPHYDHINDDVSRHRRPHPHHGGDDHHKGVPHRRPNGPPHHRLPPSHPHRRPHGSTPGNKANKPKPKPMTSDVMVKPVSKLPRPFDRINRPALNKLINGELAVSDLGKMLLPVGDVCIPTVPVSGLEKFKFDPAEFGKIVNKVIGGIGSDIHVTTTTDKEASLEVTAMASSEKLAEDITLTQTTDSSGMVSFHLSGPKWLGKDDCAFASVVLRIPETTTALVALRNNFVYGNIKIDRAIAHKITFGDFEINTAMSPIAVPPIRAANVAINSVSGGVHGYFHVSDSIAIHTVRGRIDAGVNVRRASKSTIAAESVSGKVALRVAGGFDGSFVARAIGGEVEVEDVSDGSSRLHFDKDFSRVKAGTFGPADSTRVGDSSLRATAVTGSVEIEFE